jgi:hypothetical protein
MIKLTKDNYFGPENTAITSSKARDFLKSRELYYKRYVERSISSDETPSIILGRIIDKILEQMGLHHFYRTYRRAVLKKDNPEEYAEQKDMDPSRILTKTMYDAAVNISQKAMRSPFLDFYRDRKNKNYKQLILTQPYKVDVIEFDVAGMLDRLTIVGSTAYVDDHKTSGSGKMKNPNSWAYTCQAFGYFMQLAVYQWLVKQVHPAVENVICRHIVYSTSRADCYPIRLYIIPNFLLVEPLKLFFQTAKAITIEENWTDDLPDWSDAETLPEDMDNSLIELTDEDETI